MHWKPLLVGTESLFISFAFLTIAPKINDSVFKRAEMDKTECISKAAIVRIPLHSF